MSTKKYKKSEKWRLFLKKYSLPKNCQWQFDFDYFDKLDEEGLRYLAKFIKEYYHANIRKDDKDVLHNTDELRKSCYNKKNRQNRDLYSIKRAQRRLKDDEGI